MRLDFLPVSWNFRRAAGGGPVTFSDGTAYVGDLPFREGAFGWFGASTVRTTDHVIGGTPYGRVFGSQREGMGGYRFTVPNGRHQVRLELAELERLPEFGRIMDVFGEAGFDSTTWMWRVGSAAGTRSP